MQIGPGSEDFIHTVVGGQAGAPAFVAIPGYSTGSAFLFKLFDGLSAAFHLHAVDLLGTGLSGGRTCVLEGRARLPLLLLGWTALPLGGG